MQKTLHSIQALWGKVKPAHMLIIVALAVCAYWSHFVISKPLTIWGVPEDAPIMSLAQAINIDFWIAEPGGRGISQAQFYQPGLPFQIVSWIVYRVAAATPFAPALDLLRTEGFHPDRFWMGIRVMCLLLCLAGLVMLWRRTRDKGALTSLAALSVYYASSAACIYGIYMFWNESFTLILSLLYFGYAANELNKAGELKNKTILYLGLFAGFLYMHKLNYVVWGVALVPALLAKYWLEQIPMKKFVQHAAIYFFSTIFSITTIGLLLLGPTGFREMVISHKGIFISSGIYGNGAHDVVSGDAVKTAFSIIYQTDFYTLLFFFVFLILVGLLTYQNLKNKTWLQNYLPEALLLSGGMILSMLAILKHHQPHYLVAVAAVFPLFVLWLHRVGKKNWLLFFISISIFAFKNNFETRREYNKNTAIAAEEAMQDEADILKLPLAPGEKILWMYRVVVPSFQRLFALDFAAARHFQNEANKIQGNQWMISPWHSTLWVDEFTKQIMETNWRYSVVANDTVKWINQDLHPWLTDPQTKVISLRQMKVYVNPKLNSQLSSTEPSLKEVSHDENSGL